MERHCALVQIHKRKELENFLLVPEAILRAVKRRVAERNNRTEENVQFDEDVLELLINLTDPIRRSVEAKYLSKRRPFEKSRNPSLDDSTISEMLMTEFDNVWEKAEERFRLVPGKTTIASLNKYLQKKYFVTITVSLVIDCFLKSEVPSEMVDLIDRIATFSTLSTE